MSCMKNYPLDSGDNAINFRWEYQYKGNINCDLFTTHERCVTLSAWNPSSWEHLYRRSMSMIDVYCWSSLDLIQHIKPRNVETWWRHQMETFSALHAICVGSSSVTGEFPAKRPVTRSLDIFFDLHLNKQLSKQSWGWWFKTLLRSLWRHCNEICRESECMAWTKFELQTFESFC